MLGFNVQEILASRQWSLMELQIKLSQKIKLLVKTQLFVSENNKMDF